MAIVQKSECLQNHKESCDVWISPGQSHHPSLNIFRPHGSDTNTQYLSMETATISFPQFTSMTWQGLTPTVTLIQIFIFIYIWDQCIETLKTFDSFCPLSVIKNVIELQPKPYYLLAVDSSNNTMEDIVKVWPATHWEIIQHITEIWTCDEACSNPVDRRLCARTREDQEEAVWRSRPHTGLQCMTRLTVQLKHFCSENSSPFLGMMRGLMLVWCLWTGFLFSLVWLSSDLK